MVVSGVRESGHPLDGVTVERNATSLVAGRDGGFRSALGGGFGLAIDGGFGAGLAGRLGRGGGFVGLRRPPI